ncbi:MAG: SUMF1/EgtB/PvdO family nonheme iron enzyme, partial [Planctomycetes bacterium]|nr:SUMF1/EgtB/PvdO family nonheme iron enzyme [Planctomycetota bacterium]
SEAEWEYACRAGSLGTFGFADENELGDHAWFLRNSRRKTHSVGEKQRNGFGVYDMHGNAWEWCWDWYDAKYYEKLSGGGDVLDPFGPAAGSHRVARGNNFGRIELRCYRAALRHDHRPGDPSHGHGLSFRLALTIDMANASAKSKPYPWPSDSPILAIAPFAAAQAKQHQAAWAKHLGMEIEMTNSIGMKMRVIPAGEFLMGSSEQEIAKLLADELKSTKRRGLPIDNWYTQGVRGERQRKVILTTPFAMGIHEVTRGQFRQFVEATGYKTDGEKDGKGGYGYQDGRFVQAPGFLWNTDVGFEQTDNHPVGNMTWYDAAAFCMWLSRKEGVVYRLPTEAEWEFACRAGTTTRYSFGDDASLLNDYARYVKKAEIGSKAVGRKRSNQFGLFDMHGNVAEWCHDKLNPSLETSTIDPVSSEGRTFPAFRGGSNRSNPANLRSAFFHKYGKGTCYLHCGFRIVRTFETPKPKAVSTARETDAFVILGGDDVPDRRFDTLAAAVLHASRGDTIEIRGNGPFVTDPIEIPPGRPMTIRAADGFRPVLRLSPEGMSMGDYSLLFSYSSLVLEGLELQRLDDPNRRKILRSANEASLHVANCRFLMNSGGNCVLTNAPLVVFRNCEFIGSAESYWRHGTVENSRHVFDNCVHTISLTAEVYPFKHDLSFELISNTFVGGVAFSNRRLRIQSAEDKIPTIRVEASANVFDNPVAVLQFEWSEKEDRLMELAAAEVELRRLLSWHDQRNLYRPKGRLLRLVIRGKDIKSTPANYRADWLRIWKSADADVLQGPIRFQGGDLNARARSNPEELTPEDFRLRPDSAGYRVGTCWPESGLDTVSVSDCHVVLGYLNPNNFLGGAIKLDVQRAAG